MARKSRGLKTVRESLAELGKMDAGTAQMARQEVAVDLVRLARRHTGKAMQALSEALSADRMTRHGPEPDWRARIDAAREILNRGYGKAPQLVAHATNMSDDQLAKAVAQIVTQRGIVEAPIEAKVIDVDNTKNSISPTPPRGSSLGPPLPAAQKNSRKTPENDSQDGGDGDPPKLP